MEKRFFTDGIITITINNLVNSTSKSISFHINDMEGESTLMERIRKNKYDSITGANDSTDFWSNILPKESAMVVFYSVGFVGFTEDSLEEILRNEIRKMFEVLDVEIIFRKEDEDFSQPIEQDFDYTAQSSEEIENSWKIALKKIPLPEKSYEINCDFDLLGDKLREVGLKFIVLYEFFEADSDTDTWSSLRLLFREGNRVELDISSNYSTRDENEVREIVDTFFKVHNIKMCLDGQTADYKNLTWQEAYDMLCNISRKKYVIPKGSFVEWE